VELVVRTSDDGDVWYLLNHAREEKSVELPTEQTFRDLLSGRPYAGELTLEPHDVAVLEASA
jgi:beta-galactosidase GanA